MEPGSIAEFVAQDLEDAATPERPNAILEYDSPPDQLLGCGRLDRAGAPVMYASPDVELCLHECRVTVEDVLYVATLRPNRPLKLLDLTELLEEDGTEFDSLDMAVHMLFLGGEHAYETTRAIAAATQKAGFEGLVFPSYFSLIRTGSIPFETSWGISVRKLPSQRGRALMQTVPNLGLFGRPIREKVVTVDCINRATLKGVSYETAFGPVV